MQRSSFATLRFVYCGEELFTTNSKIGSLRSVLLKMYNFYARFIEYKCVGPIVLLDFEDIRIFCNF